MREQELEAILANTLDIVLAIDATGKIRYANHAVERILGYSREEMVGTTAFDLFHPDDLPAAQDDFKKVMGNPDGSRLFEHRVRHRDGSWRFFESARRAFVDESGKPMVIINARDITKIKQIQQALQEGAGLLSNMFTSIQDGISILDNRLNIMQVNPAMETWYAHAMPIVGKRCYQAYHGRETPCIVCPSSKTLETGRTAHEVVPRVGPDGQRVGWLDLYSFPLIDSTTGQMKGIIEYVRDISDRIKAETALRDSEAQYRTTINSMGDSIHVVDSDLRFVLFNTAFKKWNNELGLESKVAGRSLFEIFPFLPKRVRGEYAQVFNTGKSLVTIENTTVGDKEFITETRKIPIIEGDKVTRVVTVIRNITESKKAEDALRESEERYRNIIEQSWQGILIADGPPFRFLFANPRVAEILGYTVEELINLLPDQILNLIHPDDLSAALDRFNEIMKKGKVLPPHEFRLIHKNGAVCWIELFGRRIEHQGKLVLQIVLLDITERKKAEVALRKNMDRLRLITDNMMDSIVQVDSQRRIVYVSPSIKRVSGFDIQDMLNRNVEEWIHPDDLHRTAEKIRKAIESHAHSVRFEYRSRNAAGAYVWVESETRLLYDDQGVYAGAIFSSRDITERKIAEDALKESEANFSALAENANDAIFIAVDERSHEYANSKAQALTGYTIKELLRLGASQLIHPDAKARVELMSRKKRKSKSSNRQYEATIIRKDKTTIPVEISVSKTVWHGKSADLVFVRDITERKKMGARIQQDIREKDVMLKEIHHRVKNNMQIISSLLNLQSQHVRDEKTLSLFQESQNRIRSMALIHERLYQSDNLASVNFGEYVHTLAFYLFRTFGIEMTNVRLKIQIRDVFLNVNMAIPCGLIVNELVSNALKYAFPVRRRSVQRSKPKNNQICIRVRPVQANQYILVVSDNGIGLPKQFDLEKSSSTGLQIVRALVSQMDGSIKLDRKKGTEYTILFKP